MNYERRLIKIIISGIRHGFQYIQKLFYFTCLHLYDYFKPMFIFQFCTTKHCTPLLFAAFDRLYEAMNCDGVYLDISRHFQNQNTSHLIFDILKSFFTFHEELLKL